jgi:homoserine kinase type II
LVHGDYWDNNVLFRDGRVVLVTDLDFMGERARIDDFALTLYYTNSTFSDDPTSDDRIGKLRTLVDAYDTGLDEPLSGAERAALPLALARTPLAFITMIASVDSEAGARRLAAEMTGDISWALDIARDLDRWRSAFAGD